MKVFAYLIPILFISFSAQAQTDDNDLIIEKIVKDISAQILERSKKRVGVINFQNGNHQTTEVGKLLAAKVSTSLSADKLILVDGSRLEILMKENKIAAKNLSDYTTLIRLGRLSGVQFIIRGEIEIEGKILKLALHAIDVDDESVIISIESRLKNNYPVYNLYGLDSIETVQGRKDRSDKLAVILKEVSAKIQNEKGWDYTKVNSVLDTDAEKLSEIYDLLLTECKQKGFSQENLKDALIESWAQLRIQKGLSKKISSETFYSTIIKYSKRQE